MFESEASEDPTILGGENLEPVDIVALCGGLLPAAAAVAARDTSELFALSKEILSVGFRLAVEVHRKFGRTKSSILSPDFCEALSLGSSPFLTPIHQDEPNLLIVRLSVGARLTQAFPKTKSSRSCRSFMNHK